MRIRRLTAIILTLLLLLGSAQAAYSPGLTDIAAQYDAGQPFLLNLTAQVTAWPDIAKETLSAFQAWLQDVALALFVQKTEQAERGAARLSKGEQTVIMMATETDAENVAMTLEAPGKIAATCYLGSLERLPRELLLGSDMQLLSLKDTRLAWQGLTVLCFSKLKPYEKAVESSVSIKNAGRGASQWVYDLKAEEANALWAQAAPELLPAFGRLLNTLPREMKDLALRGLGSMSFLKKLEVKRFLNTDGTDLGLQVTGTMQFNGVSRKLTLFGGSSGKGLYFSFKLPATKGNDTLEAQISLVYDQEKIKGDWQYRQISAKERLDASGKVNLKSGQLDGAEWITGALTARVKQAGTVKRTLDYELIPSLRVQDFRANGNLSLTVREGQALLYSLNLGLDLAPSILPLAPKPLAEVDLLSANESQLEYAKNQLRTSLLPLLQDFLFSLPMETRLLVLHDWGRDQRTEGDSVAPLDGIMNEQGNEFTVDETIGQEITKEETP